MSYARNIVAHLVGIGFAVSAIGWSAPACAQKGGAEVESAGDEAKFRVIERFPERDDVERELPGLEEGRPLVDPAIREAITQERWDLARMLVEEREDDSDPYVRLLGGYLAFEDGDFEAAQEQLDALDGEVSRLEDYRLYWAAKSAFERGDHHRAALLASKVSNESPLFSKSLLLLADSLLEAGTSSDVERAAGALELYLTKRPNDPSADRARLGLGKAHEHTENYEEAAKAYAAVIDEHPLSEVAEEAKERLEAIEDKLSDGVREKLANPSFDRRMKRYRALFDGHKSERVIDGLASDLDGLDGEQSRRCEALYLVARSHTKLRRHSDGAKWYERVLDQCEETDYALKALYMGGKGLWNAGDDERAREWFERIWSGFSDHSFADDAMYFAARILREDGDQKRAKELLETQVERYPGGDMAKDAHWLMVRQMIEDGDHRGLVEYVDGLEETGEDDVYSRGRLHYFRARALQKLGEAKRAEEAYVDVARSHPLSYYAYLSFNRLGQIASGDEDDLCALDGGDFCDVVEPDTSPEIDVAEELRETDEFERGSEFLRLGLTEFAEDEFEDLRNRHGARADLWSLAYLLDAARAHRVSHDLARRHIDGWKTHYPDEADDPRWSIAYPTPFEALVEKFANERDLPAAVVYAIMREESGFNPRIESWANARGLLQLMEGTAEQMAKEDGLGDFSSDDLFDPKTNIRLGTAYIEDLSEKLDDHPALIIAGYNGGNGNVSRWLKKRSDLPLDLWVEDIPYGQTRDYTKRVLASFWTYSWLYGDDRVPTIDFELPSK